METIEKRLYEGLFLVDSALAASDWEGVNAAIKTVLEKNDAEIVSFNKWDERKLAYEVKGKERGTYILSYFNAPPASIAKMERLVQLSEQIMRVLIIRADRMPQELVEKVTPAMADEIRMKEIKAEAERKAAEAEAAAAAEAAAPAEEEVAAEEAAPVEEAVVEEAAPAEEAVVEEAAPAEEAAAEEETKTDE